MSWYFSVALPADPAPCHDAAATLRAVARAAGTAADFLAGQSVLSRDAFGGAAAQSYRTAAAALRDDSTGVAADTSALAEALDGYAVRVASVRRALAAVRDDAVAHGFEVTADDQVEWVPAPGTEIDAVYRSLEDRAVRARAEADSAYADWWRAVQEHTTGPLASPWTVVPAPEPLVPAPDPLTRADEPRERAPRTATPDVTAFGSSPEPPDAPAPDGHAERRRTPVDRDEDVDFESALPPPVRWQPVPHPPTDPEGAAP
ncbi:hypothetical protein SFC88_03460 [Nocardioides sp. HM23]|uniref:hypothetical protein n=1 Tax=Nocardioides bizhenqiangii TaxID=3095076 RepID=UPI002ACA2661|nr:hypothetical protein [Nocardioides sp. HM23]MDZ5619866.1 hypothetical protein [Nocardioides sp. HM23]